jgi:hypothetical protein
LYTCHATAGTRWLALQFASAVRHPMMTSSNDRDRAIGLHSREAHGFVQKHKSDVACQSQHKLQHFATMRQLHDNIVQPASQRLTWPQGLPTRLKWASSGERFGSKANTSSRPQTRSRVSNGHQQISCEHSSWREGTLVQAPQLVLERRGA